MRVELQFHTEGTLVSYGWNYSFIWVELQCQGVLALEFHQMELTSSHLQATKSPRNKTTRTHRCSFDEVTIGGAAPWLRRSLRRGSATVLRALGWHRMARPS